MVANHPQISGEVVRSAALEILRKSSEPATTHEVALAVYYFTGNDRVGYSNVSVALRTLASQGAVARQDGKWSAVPQ